MGALKLKPEDVHIRDEDWELVEITPDFRRWRAIYSRDAGGQPIYVQKTEHLMGDALLEQNALERIETHGTRWSSGMGSDKGGNMPLVKVSSIPLNRFYQDVAPRIQEGGADEFLRWYLDRDENKPFRTREGSF